MQMGTEWLDGELDDVSSLLLLASPLTAAEDRACQDLLCDSSSERDVLIVSLDRSVDRVVDDCTVDIIDETARLGIVSVGESVRSATVASQADCSPIGDDSLTIDTISNPGDLTGIGVSIVKLLTEWHAPDRHLTMCFDSVSTLLQYTELQRAYRFLHVITGKLSQQRGHAHFHMTPDAHDVQTLNTIKTLFDAVIERTDDEWTIKKR